MKTLLLANQKGGVGKSAIAVQLAYYLAESRRVLVIDFDHQGNAATALREGGVATVSSTPASRLLTESVTQIEREPFVSLPADADELRQLEKRSGLPMNGGSTQGDAYASNLQGFLQAVDADFDVCIIDVNPTPDIRMISALVTADYILSPIELTQEAIDGIAVMLNHPTIGIRRIQQTINPGLHLLGILPNKVDPTPFQRQNFEALAKHYASLLIPAGESFCAIRKSTGVVEAQAAGLPVWTLGKTSSRDAWRQIKPVFDIIATRMELQ